MSSPLTYHITFGTYGTRLHGDARGTVDRRMNQPGDPIIGRDDAWKAEELSLLKSAPIRLQPEQRLYAEMTLPNVCSRGGWILHARAVREDHVHVLLTGEAPGQDVRKWLKRWLGEAMTGSAPLPIGGSWWASGGSVKYVWTEAYFASVRAYIERQQTRQRG